MVKSQYQRQIRSLQSDNGKEFVDTLLGTFLSMEFNIKLHAPILDNKMGWQKERIDR